MEARKMLVCAVFMVSLGVLGGQLIPNGRGKNVLPQLPAADASLPLQVDVLLLHLNNPSGVVYSGKKCDFFAWGCDIKAYGYIDLLKPYDEWPGQREIGEQDYFWYQGENSSPRFNKMWSFTICDPKSFTAGNLRVHMKDVDGGLRGGDDFINNFNCIFTKPAVIPPNQQSSGFTNELVCDALYSQPQMALFFKYRIYRQSSYAGCPSPK